MMMMTPAQLYAALNNSCVDPTMDVSTATDDQMELMFTCMAMYCEDIPGAVLLGTMGVDESTQAQLNGVEECSSALLQCDGQVFKGSSPLAGMITSGLIKEDDIPASVMNFTKAQFCPGTCGFGACPTTTTTEGSTTTEGPNNDNDSSFSTMSATMSVTSFLATAWLAMAH